MFEKVYTLTQSHFQNELFGFLCNPENLISLSGGFCELKMGEAFQNHIGFTIIKGNKSWEFTGTIWNKMTTSNSFLIDYSNTSEVKTKFQLFLRKKNSLSGKMRKKKKKFRGKEKKKVFFNSEIYFFRQEK